MMNDNSLKCPIISMIATTALRLVVQKCGCSSSLTNVHFFVHFTFANIPVLLNEHWIIGVYILTLSASFMIHRCPVATTATTTAATIPVPVLAPSPCFCPISNNLPLHLPLLLLLLLPLLLVGPAPVPALARTCPCACSW